MVKPIEHLRVKWRRPKAPRSPTDHPAPQPGPNRRSGRGAPVDIGYGLCALGGLLTPYSEYRHTGGSGGGSIRQIAGVRFRGGDDLELRLFSERLLQRRGETRSSLAVELQRRY